MKKITLLMIIILLVMLASCTNADETSNSFSDMDSETFLETIDIPEQLSIEINLDEIVEADELPSYRADYIEFDEQVLIESFIENDITEEYIWAEGPQFVASTSNTEEILNIQDGGESYFGTEDGMKGTFNYTKRVNNFNPAHYNSVSDLSFGARKNIGYHELNSNYSSYNNLNFLSYEEVKADIKETLSFENMPPFKIDETYSLDLDNIESNYELYLNMSHIEDHNDWDWHKDQEAYIFSMQQLIDNIPINNKPWQMPDGTSTSAWGNSMPLTYIQLIYTKDGIIDIFAYDLLNPIEELESNSLISLYEALHTLTEDYSLTILEEDISVISAELSYLNIPKDDGIELIPGWVFHSIKDDELEGHRFTSHKFDVVNAVTGELYQDRW